ncbi:S8 family serine peptidase [Clostridium sp. CTA-19]
MVNIAIIDSGINRNIECLHKNVIKTIGIRQDNLGKIKYLDNIKVENNHGTAIALCIKSIYENINFIDINILDENLSTNGKVLIEALNYVKNLDVNIDIVHLSLGTKKIKYIFKLKKAIKYFRKKHILIIAAASNYGEKSYPSHLKYVIGVKGDSKIMDGGVYYKNNFFYAPTYLSQKILNTNPQYKNINGNSIAAAYVTGQVCKKINIYKKHKFIFNFQKDNEILKGGK